MFYRLITQKRDEWFSSPECTVRELVNYICQRGKMRDAQTDAIRTWLFLKIACANAPLWKLFSEGRFNTVDLDTVPLSTAARKVLLSNKAASALFEYSRLKDRNGKQIAPELEQFITEHPDLIDYNSAFQKIFYNVSYTDYLFSLPMGAGKTYLMAAFIYLDLYFAQNEPENPSFAHNFLILAPSGLKSSIVPSLKNINEFDPSWVIPEPSASSLKKLIKFEVLDEQKSARKSNLTRNPNAQKITNHQPLEDLMGLVAVTNAEKVILDRVGEEASGNLYSKEEWDRIKSANELRNIIGKIPNLSVYIDEVHHAADSEIKLRQVVNGWTQGKSFNGVLGFSGTPYLEKAESASLADTFTIKNTELSNVVYYYPLIKGVGNFLKTPEVKYADADTETIVRNGVREFLDRYKDTVYVNGTCAKLAIYCGQIETLEEQIYPQVSEIAASYGLNPSEVILKYHGGNKTYPQPEGSETAFASLDTELSCIRIVLLVQIGKEGWDCKSLTGVILPQKGVCPTNMVLQTSCRCLRQVARNQEESALIWLNKFNADTLNKQLKQQQNISIRELNESGQNKEKRIDRFSRMEKLRVPPIDFYQLKVSYQTLIVENQPHTSERLRQEDLLEKADETLIHRQDLSGEETGIYAEDREAGEETCFNRWLCQISKESFNTLSIKSLKQYEDVLRAIFNRITEKRDEKVYFSLQFDQQEIRSRIRRAFLPKRDFVVKEETVPCHASLLQIEKLVSPLYVADDKTFYPSQEEVHEIVEWDTKPPVQALSPEVLAAIELLKAQGMKVPDASDPRPEREQTYHYLPYRFDSGLERDYFARTLLLLKDKKLELYFNGDDTLTDFKIDCYKQNGHSWVYIGKYVPDFLLLDRKADGTINRIAIIETKGEGFSAKFTDRRRFMDNEFISKNNERFGYKRFRFLYLEDTLKKDAFLQRTMEVITEFFKD